MGRVNANIRRLIGCRVPRPAADFFPLTGLQPHHTLARAHDFTLPADPGSGPAGGVVGVALENASAARTASDDDTFALELCRITAPRILLAAVQSARRPRPDPQEDTTCFDFPPRC